MTTSLISVLFLICGYSLASPIGGISQEPAVHSKDSTELNESAEIDQSFHAGEGPSKMNELLKIMKELQDESFEGNTDDKSVEAETEKLLLANISVLDNYDEDFEVNQETNGSTHKTPEDEESQQLTAMFEIIGTDAEIADDKKLNKSTEKFDYLALNKSLASMPIVEKGDVDDEADNDQNQSRAGFNPFVTSLNATDDLIVISPSFIHLADDEKTDNDTASDDDEFSVNVMNVVNDDDHEDSKQETVLPFFPLFGAPILNSVVESLQRLQNQVQSMWNVYGNFDTSVLETLPNNYKNATSVTKIVDGSLVQVNETVNKEVINGVPHLFHVKVVAVKPQNETHDATVTPSTVHSIFSEHTTTHAHDNDTITA